MRLVSFERAARRFGRMTVLVLLMAVSSSRITGLLKCPWDVMLPPC